MVSNPFVVVHFLKNCRSLSNIICLDFQIYLTLKGPEKENLLPSTTVGVKFITFSEDEVYKFFYASLMSQKNKLHCNSNILDVK